MTLTSGDRLEVRLGGEVVGSLEHRGPGRYRFTYAEGAVRDRGAGSLLLSTSLPVSAEPYSSDASRPFFEGLLPEGHIRTTIARALGVSEGNGFALLAELGGECAGAVTIGVEGAPQDGGSIEWLGEEQLADTIEELPRRPLGFEHGERGARISLGGVQDKLVLVRDATGRYGLPRGGAVSTHIVKPAHPDFADMVANEAFCLAVARCAGLRVARSEVQDLGGHSCLVVERFDRTLDDTGRLVRLHQEDACQALGYLPGEKYEADGGPGLADVMELLRDVGGVHAARSINSLVDAVALDVFLGNSDAHAKNLALLYPGDPADGAQLAPLYDLVCTNVYDGIDRGLAMLIGGVSDPDAIGPEAWRGFADQARLGPNVLPRVRELGRRVRGCIDSVAAAARAEGWHAPMIDEIRDLARERTEWAA